MFHTTDCQTVNLFRQIIMSEIPTIAIEAVDIYTNISPHHEEYIAHRLGLIPLKCTSENVDLTKIELEVNVHATTSVRNVSSKDICSNGDVVPVDDDILICKLFPGQSLHFKAFVKEGTGKEHAKWSPISCITFKEQDNAFRVEMEILGTIEPKVMIEKALTLMVN